MANIKDLQHYLNYEFSSGCYTGQDYKTFQTKYINYLKSLAKSQGWEIVNVNKNHYCFSAFINWQDKYLYLSISDVRHFENEWYKHILIRTAKHQKDYTGGMNNYTTLPDLVSTAKRLFAYA